MAYYKNQVGPTIQFQNTFNQFHKGSAYGMAAGSKFGPWGMLIGAAAGGTVGTLGSYFHNKQAYKQAQQQLRMADTLNSSTLVQTARNLNEINRQRTILSLQTQTALLYAQAQGKAQNASLANVYAAADQVGNQQIYQQSAVQNVIDQQKYQSMFNLQTQQLNLNVQVQNLINASKDRFYGVNVQGGDFSIGEALNDTIGAGTEFAKNYNSGGGSDGGNYASANTNVKASMAPSDAKYDILSQMNKSNNSSVFSSSAELQQSWQDAFWRDRMNNPYNNPNMFTASANLGIRT